MTNFLINIGRAYGDLAKREGKDSALATFAKKIYVANASWTPLYNGKDMLKSDYQKRFVFVGQEYNQADYIYTNFIYKADEKYNKNFKIPKNFKKFDDLIINDILIYSIYKKEN